PFSVSEASENFFMKGIVVYRRFAITISLIVLCIFLLSTCINNSGSKEKETIGNKGKKIKAPDFKKFAGSEVCANCHRDVYDKHILTEHHLTARLPLEKNIL